MAKIVTEVPARTGGAGAKPKYDYNSLFDGQIWALAQGEDFQTKPQNFAAGVRRYAEAHGVPVKVNVRIVEGEPLVFVHAVTDDDE